MENTKESERNLAIELLLVNMVETSGEHGLNAVDILVSYLNNVMLQDERDDIMDLLKKED